MVKNSYIGLNSAEIGNLWRIYLNDSLSTSILKRFIDTVKDKTVRSDLQSSYDISKEHMNTVTKIFNKENIPLPIGFTMEDINEQAPRLYSDTFFLFYIANMCKFGMTSFSIALYHSASSEVRDFLTDSLKVMIDFYNGLVDRLLEKGIFVEAPIVQVPRETDFLKKQNFLSGILTQPRPLLAIEVAQLFSIILSNIVGKPLILGFAQVAKSEKVRAYFLKGYDMVTRHVEEFTSILQKEDLPIAASSDTMVTDSTISPFSDKLMMYHILLNCGISASNYAEAAASSLRADLVADYARFSAEVGKYAVEGLNIMIDNGWMEQPPQIIRHEALVGSR